MKNLKKIGLFLAKWVLLPVLMLLALMPTLLGVVANLFWTAVKAGWNVSKKL